MPLSALASSLITGGATGLVGTIGNMISGSQSQQYNAANLKLQAQLQKENQTFQAKEIPSLQKQGLLDAGYNPALMSGTNLGSANSIGLSSQNPNITNPLQGLVEPLSQIAKNFSETKVNDAKVENTKANTDLQKAQTSFVDAQTNNQLFVNEFLNPLLEQKEKGIIDLNDSQTKRNQAESKVLEARHAEIMENIELLKKEGKLTDKKCDELTALINKYEAERRLTIEKITTEKTQQHLNRASAANQFSLASLNAENQNYVSVYANKAKSEHALVNKMYAKQEIENQDRQFMLDVKKALGTDYYAGKQVVEDIIGIVGDAVNVVQTARNPVRRTESKVNSTSNSTVNSTSHSTVNSTSNSRSHVHTYKEK